MFSLFSLPIMISYTYEVIIDTSLPGLLLITESVLTLTGSPWFKLKGQVHGSAHVLQSNYFFPIY